MDPNQQQGAAIPAKKKRGYAQQAYEFGGNAPGAGAPPPPGPAGYQTGVQPGFQQPGFQQPGFQQGGYQQPQEQLSSQFGQMNLGPQGGQPAVIPQQPIQPMQQPQQHQQPPPPQQQSAYLNQLQPTDLINQPFNVLELDQAPPAINLPPNVRRPDQLRKSIAD